jgi:splicing factor U2AF subunit
VVIYNLWDNPLINAALASTLSETDIQRRFDEVFEDMFLEVARFGEVEELIFCDNLGAHLVGNVYVKFRQEEDAARAVENLNDRWYAGRPITAELSPVTDFREAVCRQYDMGDCSRGGYCNFIHLKRASRELKQDLYQAQQLTLKALRRRKSRSPSGSRSRGTRSRRSRSPSRSVSGSRSPTRR